MAGLATRRSHTQHKCYMPIAHCSQQAQQEPLLLQTDASAHFNDSPEAEVQQMVSRDIGAMLLLQGRPGQGTMAMPCSCYLF